MTTYPREKLILICEESEPYFSMEKYLLERHGYYALAVSENKIVEDVRKEKPVLLVLGLTPKGSPLEICIDLRADPKIRRISVLATGFRGHITRNHILKRGANGLLWKPFSPDRFLGEVDRLANIKERHRVTIDLTLRRKKPRARAVAGASVNLSETGILVYVARKLNIGEIYHLEGLLNSGGFAVDARVIRAADELGPHYYALKFRKEPEGVRHAIKALKLDKEE